MPGGSDPSGAAGEGIEPTSEDLTFTVEVTYTDRTRLADGRFRSFATVVEVVAADDTTATMVAAQMVDGIYSHLHGMVIATRITGVVI